MKKLILWIVVMLSIFSFSCRDNNPVDIKIGVMPSLDQLPLVTALELRYFDTLGVSVELVPFSSPMERDAALQAGELDATISDYTTVITQRAKGLPVQLLTPTSSLFGLVVAPHLGATQVADLQGKRIGLSSNTVIEYATDKLIAEAGLNPEDIIKVEVQKIPLRLEMLKQGELDAAVLPEPFVQIAKNMGLTVLNTLQVEDKRPLSITGIAIHTERIKGKEQALKLFVKGYDKAVNHLNNTEPSLWIPLIAPRLRIDQEILGQIAFPHLDMVTAPKRSDIENVVLWLKSKGLISEDVQVQGIVMSLSDDVAQ